MSCLLSMRAPSGSVAVRSPDSRRMRGARQFVSVASQGDFASPRGLAFSFLRVRVHGKHCFALS